MDEVTHVDLWRLPHETTFSSWMAPGKSWRHLIERRMSCCVTTLCAVHIFVKSTDYSVHWRITTACGIVFCHSSICLKQGNSNKTENIKPDFFNISKDLYNTSLALELEAMFIYIKGKSMVIIWVTKAHKFWLHYFYLFRWNLDQSQVKMPEITQFVLRQFIHKHSH